MSIVPVRLRAVLRRVRRLIRSARYGVMYQPFGVEIDSSSWVSAKARLLVVGGGSIRIGRNCEVHPYAMLLTHGGHISIGDDSSVNPFTVIYGGGGARIGNGVRIAAHCTIVPENHIPGTDSVPVRESGYTRKGIRIEDNVWIGSGARILDGVRIGRNAVVGAGSVVTREVPVNGKVAGVPARAIRTLNDLEETAGPDTNSRDPTPSDPI
jgi:acetyltransferase-like isoleucine patch superfamily enzyme